MKVTPVGTQRLATTFGVTVEAVTEKWSGTGADVMERIAVPMIGGIVTSVIMELAVYPAIYFLWRPRELKRNN